MKCVKFLVEEWGVHNYSPALVILTCIRFSFEFSGIKYSHFSAEEIKELWAEYENNASLEANIVKDFDKVCDEIWIFEWCYKETKNLLSIDFLAIEICGETHCNTGQSTNKCVCHVRHIFISMPIFFEKLQEAVSDDQALK